MQGTPVGSLAQEASTCCGATKPCSAITQPVLYSPEAAATEACVPRACALQQEKTPKWESCALRLESSPRLAQLEKDCLQQRRSNAAEKKSVVYLDTNSKHMEPKHLNALSFTIIKERETSVNLTHIQALYTENCKTFLVYSSFSNCFRYPVPFPFLTHLRITLTPCWWKCKMVQQKDFVTVS